MAFHIAMIATGLIIGWIKKGSIWAITNVRLTAIWILPVAYLLQIVSIKYFVGHPYQVLIVISYLSMLVFCLINVRVPGLLWAFGGTLANFLVMSVNGLRMPAYVPAVEAIAPGILPKLEAGQYGKSIAMSAHTHLNFLGDIFLLNVTPKGIFSVGDLLFAIGLVILVQHAMKAEGSGYSGVSRQARTS